MKQEDKELLIQDLCTRLPYEVKVQYEDKIFTIDYISAMYEEVKLNTPNRYTIDVLEVKPYLFPFSSMTIEQKEEERSIKEESYYSFDSNGNIYTLQDFYNKNHIDYRGLIPMGLAIDCTNLNIY